MTTARDIIDLAFKDSGVYGVGQTPLTTDYNDALRRLNMMLSQWNRRRWLVYCLVDSSVACDGSLRYSVGSGGDINITRPDRIEAAYIRQVNASPQTPIDWPLEIIESREEYSQIAIKSLAAAPSEYLFYESSFPLGYIYPWPVPNDQYEIHILTKTVLQQFAAITDTVLLPVEYEQAIYLATVNQMRAAYRFPPDPWYIGQAKAALATIRKSNFQVGRLSMPPGINQGPAYNIYADRGS
jgi:hypothetical protein